MRLTKKAGVCLMMALILALAACSHGNGGAVQPSSAASTSRQAGSQFDKSDYVYPEEAQIVPPPAYQKPAELQPMTYAARYYEIIEAGLSSSGQEGASLVYRLTYEDMEHTVPTPMDTYWQAGSSAFVANKDFMAVTWGLDVLKFGLSRDGGQSWDIVEVDVIPYSGSEQSVCFTNDLLGWITIKDREGTQLLLYTTADGGKSWNRVCFMDTQTSLQFRFASREVGWMMQGVVYANATVYETVDGGVSWYPLTLKSHDPDASAEFFAPVYLPGYSLLLGWLIEEPDNWLTGPAGFHLAAGEKAMWELRGDLSPLPAGTTYGSLICGTSLFFPMEYNWKQGLDPEKMSGFWLAYQTLQYVRDNYGESAVNNTKGEPERALLTAAQVKEYVYYQYNASDFDVTKVEEYDAEAGGLWHNCAHGGLGLNMYLRIVKPGANGELELYFDVVEGVLGAKFNICTGTYYMLVRPRLGPGGQPMVTVLECRPLTPLPENQSLFFSV